MKAIVVRDGARALQEIEGAFHREFPRAGILAVGLGRRRLEQRRGAPLRREVVLKIILRRKLRPLPRGLKRIPPYVDVSVPILGQRARIRIATDLEQATQACATRYRIGPLARGSLCLGSYARWTKDGTPRRGGLTAGHGLWDKPSDPGPRRSAMVQVGPGCPTPALKAKVVWASHMKRDGIDVALLEFAAADFPVLSSCAKSFFTSEPSTPSGTEIAALLGNEGDLLDLASEFRHFDFNRTDLEAIAYFPTRTIDVAGWGVCTLTGAVESTGPADSFPTGTSGSGVVSRPPTRRALGIQSLCLDSGPVGGSANQRGLSCTFAAAVEAIRVHTALDVALHWRV